MPKAFLVDTTRCTACRGCQVACKEWKDHPPVATKQTGTHQNPPDLNPYNYKLVRFSEHLLDGVVKWYFFPDQCRHCVAPPCKNTADMSLEGAIIQDEASGAVIFTEKTKEISKADQESIRESCPYDIPRLNEKTGLLTKCDMCIDRVQANRLPMCVKSCAMGAMHFGEREEILKLAEARLAEVKPGAPNAKLLDAADVAVIFLVEDDPKRYHSHAVAQLTAPAGPLSRQEFLARANPLKGLVRTFHG